MYFSFYHFLSKLQNCVKWSTTNTFWFHCYFSGSASPSEWINFQLAHRRTATAPNLLQPDILVRKGPVRTRLCERWVQEEKWGAGPEGKGGWRDKVKRGKVTVTETRSRQVRHPIVSDRLLTSLPLRAPENWNGCEALKGTPSDVFQRHPPVTQRVSFHPATFDLFSIQSWPALEGLPKGVSSR